MIVTTAMMAAKKATADAISMAARYGADDLGFWDIIEAWSGWVATVATGLAAIASLVAAIWGRDLLRHLLARMYRSGKAPGDREAHGQERVVSLALIASSLVLLVAFSASLLQNLASERTKTKTRVDIQSVGTVAKTALNSTSVLAAQIRDKGQRSVAGAGLSDLVSTLKGFRDGVCIVRYGNMEASVLGVQVTDILASMNIPLKIIDIGMSSPPVYGVRIHDPQHENGQLFRALAEAGLRPAYTAMMGPHCSQVLPGASYSVEVGLNDETPAAQ